MTLTDVRSDGGASPRRGYWSIQAYDVLITVTTFVLAFSLRTEFAFSDPDWLAMLVGIPIVAVVAWFAYHAVGLFRGTWSQTTEADLFVVVKGASLTSVCLTGSMVLSDTMAEMPRSVPLIHWFITVVALSGSRIFWARWHGMRVTGPEATALLIGCDHSALRYLTSIRALSSGRFKIFGILDGDREDYRIGRTIRGTPVVGRADRAEQCLSELSVHGVFPERLVMMKSFCRRSPELVADLAKLADGAGLTLDVIDDGIWGDEGLAEDKAPAFEGKALEMAKPSLSVTTYMMCRRPIELVVAAVLVTVLLPLFLLIAVVCAIDVGRPVIFWQMRPGRHLEKFKLTKFRTMRSGLDANKKPLSDEARTSTLGGLIRRSKLDELPQLFSILKGDMSFIGPRPLLPRDQPEDARLRATVRPGVTGWAQVNGGHPLEIEEKLALDIWYIQNASLLLDIKIVWLTIRTMLFGDRVNRQAIDLAMKTRELLRPAAQQPDVAFEEVPSRQPVVLAKAEKAAKPGKDKVSDRPWWDRPVGSLDRAS
jgi:lipopolysaccharide/colanic/teichoic acid biosynthesis glycosyltransferase